MKEEKTTLKKICEQKAEQIRIAIEQAIDDGAKTERCNSYVSTYKCCLVDGVFLQNDTSNDSISVILKFRSDKISKLFEPSKEDLKKILDQKRAELEEIEKQINEKQ